MVASKLESKNLLMDRRNFRIINSVRPHTSLALYINSNHITSKF